MRLIENYYNCQVENIILLIVALIIAKVHSFSIVVSKSDDMRKPIIIQTEIDIRFTFVLIASV